MRVQCSLIINDNEVYEAIQDLKEQKELNPLLARLITRYIEDENFRLALDADAEYAPEGDVNFDSVYAETRENLATLDILLQDAENVFNDGKSTLEDCMEQAENIGVMKRNVDEETGAVSQVSLIEAKQQLIKEEEAGDDDMLDIKFIAKQLQQVTSRVDTIMSDIAMLKSKGIIADTTKETVEDEPVFDEEVISEQEPVELGGTDTQPTQEVEEQDTEDFTFVQEDVPEKEEEPETSQSGEASSDIGDLLSSLF